MTKECFAGQRNRKNYAFHNMTEPFRRRLWNVATVRGIVPRLLVVRVAATENGEKSRRLLDDGGVRSIEPIHSIVVDHKEGLSKCFRRNPIVTAAATGGRGAWPGVVHTPSGTIRRPV